MNIEFVGLPGVGKTTIFSKLLRFYPDLSRFVVPNRPATMLEKVEGGIGWLRYPGLLFCLRGLRYQAEIKMCIDRYFRRSAYLNRYGRDGIVEAGTLQPILEGVMYTSIQRHNIDWHSLAKSRLCNKIVILVADCKLEAIERERERKGEWTRNLSFSDLEHVYREGQIFLDQMCRCSLFHTIDLDQSASSKSEYEQIYQQIIASLSKCPQHKV